MRQEVLFELRLFFFFFCTSLHPKQQVLPSPEYFPNLFTFSISTTTTIVPTILTLLDYCILTGLSACQILRWLPITLRLILNLFTMVYKSSYRFWPLPLSLSLVIFHCVYPSQVSLSCLYLNIKPNMLPSCFWFW